MIINVEIQILFEKFRNDTNFTFNCAHPTEAYCKQQEEVGFYKGWVVLFWTDYKFI